MAKSNRGLGMGLEALLKMNVQNEVETKEGEVKEVVAGFVELSLDKIMPNPNQPRKNFDEESLNELSQSIKNFGLLQPISVIKNGDFYEIIAGERRYRAAKKAGLDKIPVIIKNISQKEKLEISLVENIQRENLNSIEEALAYSSLIDTYQVTQEELADRIGKSRSTITNSIRLLNLDAQIRKWIIEGKLTPGHARAILSLEETKEHLSLANYLIENNLSVRDAEILSKKWPIQKKKTSLNPKKDADIKNLEKKLQEKLQTKVLIEGNSKKGKIAIDYYSMDDLDRIIEILGIKL
jgi:ParB family transcriptional regulator, chromosome partitioning protein